MPGRHRRAVRGAPERHDPSCADCWGAQLQRTDTSRCTPGHVVGARHFKTKFCTECKATMIVSSARVRALSEEHAVVFANNHSGGLWTKASEYGVRYRVVNNTNGCLLPVLVIFEEEAPRWFDSVDMPKHLQSADGYMRLCVSKGTLVPLCEVLVPSVFMTLANGPPTPESSEAQSPSCDSDESAFSSYQEKRMHRNRLSAAKSRRMKREHIDNLERQVLELSQTVDELRRENSYWQSLEAVDPEEALRIELAQFISEPSVS